MRLSRKTSFLILTVFSSLLVGGLFGFYFYTKNKSANLAQRTPSSTVKQLGYNPTIKTNPSGTSTEQTTNTKVITKTQKLRQITDKPVVGADFVLVDVVATSSKNIEPPDLSVSTKTPIKNKQVVTEERIRWVERETGHVYETFKDTTEVNRISNTTNTRLNEALFVGKGDSLILRDLVGSTDVIRTRFATLNLDTPTSTEQTLTTSDLPINILEITRSPDRKQLFSLMYTGVRGILSNNDGSLKSSLFDNPINEWLVSWPNKQTIVINTKPSGGIPGYAYTINPQTKVLSRLLGDIPGLTTLVSPDGNYVLYTAGAQGSIKLYSYNKKTNQKTDLILRTFTDKCVWSSIEKNIVYCGIPQDIAFNLYPDAWYQGRISFADSVWSINVDTLETQLLSSPLEEVGFITDTQNLVLSADNNYLLFQNKIDLSLWALKLKEDTPEEINPIDSKGVSATTNTSTKVKSR